jgi:hypothetical protein
MYWRYLYSSLISLFYDKSGLIYGNGGPLSPYFFKETTLKVYTSTKFINITQHEKDSKILKIHNLKIILA